VSDDSLNLLIFIYKLCIKWRDRLDSTDIKAWSCTVTGKVFRRKRPWIILKMSPTRLPGTIKEEHETLRSA
jgi:hypothetical protein